MDKIYVITTMTKLEQDNLAGWPNFGDTRTVAWYDNFDDSEKCVVYNYGDIWETCYDYAVIEEVEAGLYPVSRPRWFYKYNQDSGEYEKIDEPEWMCRFVNIGMG